MMWIKSFLYYDATTYFKDRVSGWNTIRWSIVPLGRKWALVTADSDTANEVTLAQTNTIKQAKAIALTIVQACGHTSTRPADIDN